MINTPEISYLGPPGTYSEQAAEMLYGKVARLKPHQTLPGTLTAAETGLVDAAVLPVENSSEGAVRETHHLLVGTDLQIASEVTIPIEHALLGAKGAVVEQAQVVYSHPQTLGQCRQWLQMTLPEAKLVPTSSNSAAAEMITKGQASLAIASERAARVYDLDILEKAINDQSDNQTRFISLGKDKPEPTGYDKTSLVCVLEDGPGALHSLLGDLAVRQISMTRIVSQPHGGKEYSFYIDFLGSTFDDEIAEALDSMQKQTKFFKVLGSYPVTIEGSE